jgi:hypothetical protein
MNNAPRTITDAHRCDALVAGVDGPPVGLSKSTVGRIWKAFQLKPHLTGTVKLSTDPQFIDKVRDVVGLYLDPPERALMLCVDEKKSQVQALDRSQPVLPMLPGMPERRTHDHQRNGITSLFAAFNIADGTVIGELHRQHRAVEFKQFLATIDKAVPQELDVHLICDNYGTHKTPAIKLWLGRHPRFHLHVTPTGSSWINQVERWFGFLTEQLIQRGVHKSVQPWWSDTLEVGPGERYEVAFRADNPGIWMDHCHNLEHATVGMTMHLAYEGVSSPYAVGDATGNHPE